MLKRHILECETPQSIARREDKLHDWVAGGNIYELNGKYTSAHKNFAYNFDAVKVNKDGSIAVIYQKLGTKGIILQNGEILREINRSFYQANVYEYPICLTQLEDGTNIIIHCPEEYCRIEIQEIETGKILTKDDQREPIDNFYSRIECSNQYMLSAGWVWHPYDVLNVYQISDVLHTPKNLDTVGIGPEITWEVSSARFYGQSKLLLSTFSDEENEQEESDILPNSILYYDLETKNIIKQIRANFNFGNTFAIDDDFVLDMMTYPKIINMNTGKIEEQFEDIDSGQQATSIIHHLPPLPHFAINNEQNKIAITTKKGIEILEIIK